MLWLKDRYGRLRAIDWQKERKKESDSGSGSRGRFEKTVRDRLVDWKTESSSMRADVGIFVTYINMFAYLIPR